MDICPHINSINVDAIKKKLPSKLQNLQSCDSCIMMQVYKPQKNKKKNKKNKNKNNKEEVGEVFDRLEICLSCLSLNWGELTTRYHASTHFKNKKHPIVLNTLSLDLYCFICEYSLTKLRDEIAEGKETERIDDIINTVATLLSGKTLPLSKKDSKAEPKKEPEKAVEVEEAKEEEKKLEKSVIGNESEEQKESRELHEVIFQSALENIQPEYDLEEEAELFCIRGMNNLGNTCFFNSVMQWLNATKDLYFMYSDNTNGWYGAGYLMNNQFRKYLNGMRNKDHKSLSPKGMLNAICRKHSRFHGGNQHDAHELLITMLDCLDSEATKQKKRSIADQAFGGTFCNSVLWLTCLNVSRTVQRFTDVIVELNFKKGSKKNKQKYNSHQSFRMSKRDRKRLKNKKNKQRNKGKYFTQDWHDQYDTSQNNANQNEEKQPAVSDKTLQEYLFPEEFKNDAESLDPKIYYPFDAESTILDEYNENEEPENNSENGQEDDSQSKSSLRDQEAEGEDDLEGEKENRSAQEGENDKEQEDTFHQIGENDQDCQADDKHTHKIKENTDPADEYVFVQKEDENGSKSNNSKDNSWEVVENDEAISQPTTQNETEKETEPTIDEKEPLSQKGENRTETETQQTREDTKDEPSSDEESKEEAKEEDKEEEIECTEGEDFVRSNLEFENYKYYEPVEQNQSIKNSAKAETLEDALKFFVKSEHLSDDYYCDRCDEGKYETASKAVRRTLFLKPPRNLVINIKRFTQSMYNVSKDSTKLKFPLRLCLDKYMASSIDINSPEEIVKYDEMTASSAKPINVYDLYGIVSHSGGMSGGHYVCYISFVTATGKEW